MSPNMQHMKFINVPFVREIHGKEDNDVERMTWTTTEVGTITLDNTVVLELATGVGNI